jgi:ATP-dependent DNA helicase RecG
LARENPIAQGPEAHPKSLNWYLCEKKIAPQPHILSSPIEYLHGVSVIRGDMLRKELGIHTFQDLLDHYPFRHIDRTRVDQIGSLHPGMDYAQLTGTVMSVQLLGEKRQKRLVAQFRDHTGVIELVWFQGIQWVEKQIVVGSRFLIFGRLSFFQSKPQMAHPEIANYDAETLAGASILEPVYPSTEKLKAKGLNGQAIGKLARELFKRITPHDISENIPETILKSYKLMSRYHAYQQIHLPKNQDAYKQAVRRLKFEELFLAQFIVQTIRIQRNRFSKGLSFEKVGDLFNHFFEHEMPFMLTGAQKRVLKEIRKDLGTGRQMNRLLQGDVGSGKTMVALLTMLLAADNGFQSVLMAPTEILAQQHLQSITGLLRNMDIRVECLTGSTSTKQRRKILEGCADGSVHMLIGTHAVIEDQVVFQNLGLAVIDEQHKFGVAQRAKLWKKNLIPPHILVMTATPIPRTLAMTAYGDLDYSVIDELPPGREPIDTKHRYEHARPAVMDFIKAQVKMGRQAYVIYPLIEESSKMDYENLMKGYEEVKSFFPEPKYHISMVHGKQPAEQKETNMHRFVTGDTQIMVGTTVIEVGVNVPNATVMVLESAEKFGLSQLHQLRGRVGRGGGKSYCILLTGMKLSGEARARLKIMTETNDGFKIAEKDLELRGPGEMEGTRQSGALQFKLANLVDDRAMVEAARNSVCEILEDDPELQKPEHQCLNQYFKSRGGRTGWSKIA